MMVTHGLLEWHDALSQTITYSKKYNTDRIEIDEGPCNMETIAELSHQVFEDYGTCDLNGHADMNDGTTLMVKILAVKFLPIPFHNTKLWANWN